MQPWEVIAVCVDRGRFRGGAVVWLCPPFGLARAVEASRDNLKFLKWVKIPFPEN